MRTARPVSLLVSVTIALLQLLACDKKDDGASVILKTELLRIEASNYAALTQKGTGLTGIGASKTTDVSIKSLKYPIGSISLSGEPPAGQTSSASGDNAMSVYECSGTSNDACLVELTGSALTNLLAEAPTIKARVGTYSQINIGPCFQGGVSEDVRVKLTAEATIDGVLYYTNATTGLSPTGPAEEVTFSPRSGCGTVKYLTKDLVIGEKDFKAVERPVSEEESLGDETTGELSEELNLKLYFDLANAVIAAGPSTDPQAANELANSDFCKGQTTRATPFICINFPEIIGTVDAGTPTLTRMLINSSTIWGFYSSSEGVPFGAYQRAYYNGFYSSASEPQFLVGSMFQRFQVHGDGTVSFSQYDDGQNRHLGVSHFKLADHTGTMTRGVSETLNYTAEKLP